MMRKTKTLFLMSCLFLSGIGGYAQSPVKIYSGASSPTEQSWTELKLDNTVNTLAAATEQEVGSGVLKLTSTNAANQFSQLGWYKTGLGLDLSKGYTIEIKAKLIVAGKGAFNIQGYDNEGKGFRVGISTTQLTNLSNPLDATTVIKSDLTNDNAFHTYRLAVAPSGLVTVYRDAQSMGTFQMGAFQFDNIIENGGFEDEEFPDFSSNGILTRVTDHKLKYTGGYALEMNNNGLITDYVDNENAVTRELAIKPNTEYEISITRRRTGLEPWAWRDMGTFYDFDFGSLGLKGKNEDMRREAEDHRDSHMFASVNDRFWQAHNQKITTPENAKTLRFEFPSWNRDGKKTITSSFDNFIFREKPTLAIGTQAAPATFVDQVPFHAGYVNLIQNGDFEDWTKNNDGSDYEWALSDPGSQERNDPFRDNVLWNTNTIRIQRSSQNNDDVGADYAHSGQSSVRFTTNGNRSNNFDFAWELEANKTYRFNFWHRAPKWDDVAWLMVRIGDGQPVWGHHLRGRNNKWTPCDIVFTTTEENHTLHLYTDSDHHDNWMNVYLDDFVLYEIPAGTPLDPQIAGKTNLIANGDFEDVTKNNDGSDYDWAVASVYTGVKPTSDNPWDDDFSMKYNPMWGTHLRIQDQIKKGGNHGDNNPLQDWFNDRDDTGLEWAHSGTKSLRFSFQDSYDNGQKFEGLWGETGFLSDVLPDAYRLNINFQKELEPNKTYTFVFWIKTSCWDDRGWFNVANGDIKVLRQELSNKFLNWTRQSVTFSTTGANHTLRMFTEFGGWMSFYLDDLFLYEEDTYVPYEANGDSYLFFGKSQNTASADVEVEYVKAYRSGAYAPGEENFTITYHADGGTGASNSTYEAEKEGATTLPVPAKNGYTFGGWYDNSEFTGDAVTEIPEGSLGSKEFYAKWDIITYTITYHLNGGVGVDNGTYTIESETIILPVPTREGYEFRGWFNTANLRDPAITEIAHGSTGDRPFYAKWELAGGINAVDAEVLRVYPNPVTDGKLTLVNLSNGGKVEIRNVIGTLAGVYDVTERTMEIDLSAMPAGTYIVKANGQIAKILKK